MRNKEPRKYQFGELKLTFLGLGVPFLSDKTKERIRALPADELRSINREAWKQRRAAERAMNRYCNVTMYGNDLYDGHAQLYDVAKAVCTETWKALQ